MNGLPYYKAYPRDFIEGTVGMSFELKGAYRLVLDLIYMQGGKLPDDARYISGLLGCSVKKWIPMREALLATGKITACQGYLGNHRADQELDSLKSYQTKQADNRRGTAKNNDLAEAVVKPKGNHTEPEPDTVKEAVARERAATAPAGDLSKGAAPDTHREKLLAAMGIGPDGIAGPSSFIGTQADMAEVARWEAMGIDRAAQLAVIAEACRRQRAKDPNWMPRRFAYFTPAMADLSRAKSGAQPAAGADPRAAQIAKWKRIAGAAT